jgi:L-threonylcarbamoyladenylate synthase
MISLVRINPIHPEKEKIAQAVSILRRDGLIGYPTETVYGLGAHIFSEPAVQRIFTAKGRSATKAMILIVSAFSMLENLVQAITPSAQRLIQHFWPGPLTLIFEATAQVPPAVCGGGSSIAIRIPQNQICLDLIDNLGFPITSTSANLAGGANPLSARQVQQTFGDQLDLIIDGGPAQSSLPSTLLDVRTEPAKLVRAGAIDVSEIERICRIEKP